MNNTKLFELMGDINDKYFAENYEEPQRVSYTVRVSEKRGAKRWIIPAAIATAACLALGIAAPRITDTLRSRNVIDIPANGADAKTLREWLALPHNAINSSDSNVIFTPTETSDEHVLLTFSGETASDIYAVDDCTVKYTGYANTPYLGKVIMVQFDNGLWGLYRNSYTFDDHYDTEISVKAGDRLKAGDRIGAMYPYNFKLLISVTEPSAELFTPAYPELDEWEKRHSTLPVAYHNPYSEEKAPEYLTENLGYRGWHSRFYFIGENEPAYAVADGTVYAIPGDTVDMYVPQKNVIIKLDTDFDTPLYAIYRCLNADDLNIKVGDTVKEGDVIGKAFYSEFAAPVGMTLTISTTPYVPEVDDDGNIINAEFLSDWLAQPHNAINSTKKNVTLTPTEISDGRALLTLDGSDLTDIYAIDDCTVTRVGYANAPYLGKVVSVEFDNGLWGIYRSSYKYDEASEVEIAVKAGDKLKAGDRIGSMYADGFKLLIGGGNEPLDIISPRYPELAKQTQFSSTEPITHREGIVYVPAENIGYHAWYTDLYVIDGSAPAYAVSDGEVVEVSEYSHYAKKVVIKLDTLLDIPIYATYDALAPDSVTVKVGDTVKEGDAIGDAFTSPDGGPVTFTLTISVSPNVPEIDGDGNIIGS